MRWGEEASGGRKEVGGGRKEGSGYFFEKK
jgi:hypothetical protein